MIIRWSQQNPKMVLSLDRWVGKVAVVTGASSGIGAAIVEFLVTNGINVVGLARRSEIVEAKAKELSVKKGKLYAVKADMSKEEDIVKAFKWIDANVGHVHILINNAGVARENFMCDGNATDWKMTFNVNVLGLSIAAREAVKIMTANNIKGHIININSIAGHKAIFFPGVNVYTASKHAVTALTETILDTESKLRLSPGFVASEMTTLNSEFTKERQELLKAQPILEPKDITEGIGYVLSTPEHVQINELTITPVGEKF